MKYISILLLLIIYSTGNVMAHDKPSFIVEIERVFQEKESRWKIERKNVQNESSFFKEDIVFRLGKVQAAVSIGSWQKEKDAHDVFEGEAIAFNNTAGARMIKKRLPNLGDENYIWVNRGSEAWPMIKFRKGRVHVTVFAPNVAIAKRFAQYIAEQIPV